MKTKTGLKAGQARRNNTALITVNVAQNSGDNGEAEAG
jgi:hypothetical protein